MVLVDAPASDLGPSEQARLGGACAPVSDLESYLYRIGTVHMSRDAAYADAGVRSGTFIRLLV